MRVAASRPLRCRVRRGAVHLLQVHVHARTIVPVPRQLNEVPPATNIHKENDSCAHRFDFNLLCVLQIKQVLNSPAPVWRRVLDLPVSGALLELAHQVVVLVIQLHSSRAAVQVIRVVVQILEVEPATERQAVQTLGQIAQARVALQIN